MREQVTRSFLIFLCAQCPCKLHLAVSGKDGTQKSGPVLLYCSRSAVTTAAGWGAEDGECFTGKCSWMERDQLSTASILPGEARALGHYTCSDFDLELIYSIISSYVLSFMGFFPHIA